MKTHIITQYLAIVGKFINAMMIQGKKSTATRCLYKSLEIIGKKLDDNPLEVFLKAIENTKPMLEVKSRRVGGSTYQVPIEVKPDRGITLAMRWIIANSRNRSGRSMIESLSAAIFVAA